MFHHRHKTEFVSKNLVQESIKFGVSLQARVASATPSLFDAGVVTEDDTSKVVCKKTPKKQIQQEIGYRLKEISGIHTPELFKLFMLMYFDNILVFF